MDLETFISEMEIKGVIHAKVITKRFLKAIYALEEKRHEFDNNEIATTTIFSLALHIFNRYYEDPSIPGKNLSKAFDISLIIAAKQIYIEKMERNSTYATLLGRTPKNAWKLAKNELKFLADIKYDLGLLAWRDMTFKRSDEEDKSFEPTLLIDVPIELEISRRKTIEQFQKVYDERLRMKSVERFRLDRKLQTLNLDIVRLAIMNEAGGSYQSNALSLLDRFKNSANTYYEHQEHKFSNGELIDTKAAEMFEHLRDCFIEAMTRIESDMDSKIEALTQLIKNFEVDKAEDIIQLAIAKVKFLEKLASLSKEDKDTSTDEYQGYFEDVDTAVYAVLSLAHDLFQKFSNTFTGFTSTLSPSFFTHGLLGSFFIAIELLYDEAPVTDKAIQKVYASTIENPENSTQDDSIAIKENQRNEALIKNMVFEAVHHKINNIDPAIANQSTIGLLAWRNKFFSKETDDSLPSPEWNAEKLAKLNTEREAAAKRFEKKYSARLKSYYLRPEIRKDRHKQLFDEKGELFKGIIGIKKRLAKSQSQTQMNELEQHIKVIRHEANVYFSHQRQNIAKGQSLDADRIIGFKTAKTAFFNQVKFLQKPKQAVDTSPAIE
ncbi:MAG: hypothetical protein K0R66_1374 [Gammaproteobacteria bacterium]|jgi:hypothetical protein|nr:hypothetical protein [Gammaproteobacteria bacterium]